MEGSARDSFDRDHQIENEERRRDDQDEASEAHCFPQSGCRFSQESGDARTYIPPT